MCCFGGAMSGVVCIQRVNCYARPPARPLPLPFHRPPLILSYSLASVCFEHMGRLADWPSFNIYPGMALHSRPLVDVDELLLPLR